jgi:tRNA pseudouridine65 synthase
MEEGGEGRNATILYRDDHILIVDKPPGLLVHPNAWDPKAPTVVHSLAGALGRRVYNVHRLDRGTSGVVVFALTRESAKALADQFKSRTVKKRYIAVVRGHLTEETLVDTPIREKNGKAFEALTRVRPLSRGVIEEPLGPFEEAWFSLVEIDLETGRRHQARRHLNYVSHPVIGDRQHGDRRNNRFFIERFGCRELLLRAITLEFNHPGGERLRAFGGLPDWWRECLRAAGLEPPKELLREARIRFV